VECHLERHPSFPAPAKPMLSRSETRFRVVSWGFTAGSAAWLGPSRGAAITRLPPGVSAPVECILGRVAVVTEAVMCAHAVSSDERLLHGDGDHVQEVAVGRSVLPGRRVNALPGGAVPVGHDPRHQGRARPVEAARLQHRQLRLAERTRPTRHRHDLGGTSSERVAAGAERGDRGPGGSGPAVTVGQGQPAASAGARLAAFGVPRPVTGSQPLVAGKPGTVGAAAPLLPVVTS
jgi:hypothetical protein